MLALSIVALAIAASSSMLLRADTDPMALIVAARRAGESVAGHIALIFGVLIPVLLGFYALIVGQQLVDDPIGASRTRRKLALLAEAVTASFVPAFAVVALYAVSAPSRASILLVVGPAAFVTLALTVMLGRMATFDPEQQLVEAKITMDWARRRLEQLGLAAAGPTWAALLVNVLAASAAAVVAQWAVTMAAPRLSDVAVFVLASCLLVGACWIASSIHSSGRGLDERIPIWGMPVALTAGSLAAAVSSGLEMVIAVSTLIVVVAGSTLWPASRSDVRTIDLTLRGAGQRTGVRTVARVLKQSKADVARIEAVLQSRRPSSWRWLRRGLRARVQG
ncbi:hypothetical protein [Agrococcus beijingensis]|uniref:hypothetical protein n=1 Tax=Agrococcus beijingensis TaxID=3068634 RepID=UPI0027427E07|nr:hypothetical protein [Agrococcus sp. REN33]